MHCSTFNSALPSSFSCPLAPLSFSSSSSKCRLAASSLHSSDLRSSPLEDWNSPHVGQLLKRRRRPGSFPHKQKRQFLPSRTMAGAVISTDLPSWDTLLQRLGGEKDTPFRLSHAKTRIFNPGEEPALIFYRDNSSWCPYCERVWIQLEEKKIPYEVEKVNMRCYGEKPEWYNRMVPSGLLPALKLDGKVLTESLDIMLILEEAFPNHKRLLPSKGTVEASSVDRLLKLERQLVGAWLGCLRGFWGSINSFEKVLDNVNDSLQQFGGPYFLGSEVSLVDAVYAPFLERIAASVPYFLGPRVRNVGRWPALNAWFDAMDSRPAYQAVKSDDFTIVHTLEPQVGQLRLLSAGAAYRNMIDGKDGSWDLPLKPEETAWGRDDGSGSGGANEEAARSLIGNHEAIVEFSLRGVTDPEQDRTAVNVGFRYVAYALLVGKENVGYLPKMLSGQVAVAVAAAAAYLRDRVGVPRDLSYPAARQLRAHLHLLVKLLDSDL